ncbi:unnamed protein product [Trichobilharzia regenti]|nr:unnamed protein product [Trichobilharzia regenti]
MSSQRLTYRSLFASQPWDGIEKAERWSVHDVASWDEGYICARLASPGQSSTALSSSSSAGSTGPESDAPNYRKLIHAVLDAKKSALLRSPHVIDFLSSRQRALTDYKRQTELFSVTMNK